jgi:hypothetical protein
VALTTSELELLKAHKKDLEAFASVDELNLRYYRGLQRVQQLGMAIPPSMRNFLVIANWCRVVVDTINSRQQVRWLILPGQESADPQLRAIGDASDLATQVSMFNRDRMIFGRAFMSVGANEDEPDLPLIRAESPREISVFFDKRRETATSACRFYGNEEPEVHAGPKFATLYLPNETIWLEYNTDSLTHWDEVDRDVHNLGAVPIAWHLNRRITGSWVGEPQIADMIPLADAAARSLTNLQFAQEAHGIPRMYMTGVAKGDFVAADGTPIPQFEAYFDAIHTLTNANAKIGQLSAADLKNFDTAINLYGKQAATVTGFPARYFGLTTANPSTEGAIRAEEATMTRSIEEQNEQVGATLGFVGALALRFAREEWVPGRRVKVDWYDPSTPTVAQRADAITKLAGGDSPILSREGAWDELGWSDSRKAKERAYFEAQARDPFLSDILGKVNAADDAAGVA